VAVAFFTIFRLTLAFTNMGRFITILTISRIAAISVAAFFVYVTYIKASFTIPTTLLSCKVINLAAAAITAAAVRPPVIALATTALLIRVFAAFPAAAIHTAQTLTLRITTVTAAE
jgi:hypothetical protein